MTNRSVSIPVLLLLLPACGASTDGGPLLPLGSAGAGLGGTQGGQTSASGGTSGTSVPNVSGGLGGAQPTGGTYGGGSGGVRSTSGGSSMTSASGSPSTGGASATSTGGVPSTGGTVSTGGKATTGGTASTGGRTSMGGRASTGGRSSTGGAGGTNTAGGTSSAGAGSGGMAQGGQSGGAGGAGSFRLPPANAPFDYQIGGAYAPPQGVQVVSRDRESSPAAGLYNICYVNGFQSQPGEDKLWLEDHPDLVLRDSSGEPVIDENWDEMLLDTSTEAKRTELATIVGGWIRGCASSGFNAVEIDNLDSYSRSGGLLKEANNIAFMKLLSAAAHQSGLAIAQKNSSELVGQAKQMGTDFAVVEECNRWDECGDYQSGYGNLVFIIEYRRQDFTKGCTGHPELSIVLRDLNVSAPGNSSYVYDGC
ncbi:MAG TPA: endo alpha-1,4 polygalactosaminidase [Polyangiaceae bacterium]|nr:endo alpha-1,4 polygalactosaminidase [Polyangiaceae bacterium]